MAAYPTLVDPTTGNRRATFRRRQKWLQTVEIQLSGSDVLVEGMVLESAAATLWGNFRLWWILADASPVIRHPAEWGYNTILVVPNLTTLVTTEDPQTEPETGD
jgi:hypothetical protein